jgi:hypothetical protein
MLITTEKIMVTKNPIAMLAYVTEHRPKMKTPISVMERSLPKRIAFHRAAVNSRPRDSSLKFGLFRRSAKT